MQYTEATVSMGYLREQKLGEASELMEARLVLLGCVAIEDKLQVGDLV